MANEGGLNALAEEMVRSSRPTTRGNRPAKRGKHRHRSAKARRRRKWAKRSVVISLCLVLLLAGGAAGYAYYVLHSLKRVQVKGLHSALTTGVEAGTENILMVGSTSRCALSTPNPAYGLCSQGVTGVNSDIVMVLHVDPAHHQLGVLSIPRDLFVPNARSDGAYKIDAGLDQGLSQVVAAVEQDFAIPIQHAVSLNFDQFANVVDAFGGINMSFPMSVFDWGANAIGSSGLNVEAAACVHLNGTQALEVVRSREMRYKTSTAGSDPYDWPIDPGYELSRIRRTHEFLRLLASSVSEQGLGNPITDLDLINSVKGDLTFDQSWSVSNMVDLVREFHSVNVDSVPQLTLPVSVDEDLSGYTYDGKAEGDVEFPSEAPDQAAIDQVLGISATTDSMTGGPLPVPSTVKVSVMDGTGTSDQATTTANALTALGFSVVGTGSVTPVASLEETLVAYGSRTPTVEAEAEAVARSMTGSVILDYDPSAVADGADVTVVTGSQFGVNAPVATATPTTAATGAAGAAGSSSTAASSGGPSGPGTGTTPTTAASSTTTTSPSASRLAAPTSATQAPEPWDPRACARGATPTAPVPNPLP